MKKKVGSKERKTKYPKKEGSCVGREEIDKP